MCGWVLHTRTEFFETHQVEKLVMRSGITLNREAVLLFIGLFQRNRREGHLMLVSLPHHPITLHQFLCVVFLCLCSW